MQDRDTLLHSRQDLEKQLEEQKKTLELQKKRYSDMEVGLPTTAVHVLAIHIYMYIVIMYIVYNVHNNDVHTHVHVLCTLRVV